MSRRKTPKKKERNNSDLWMYDENENNAIKKFVRRQGDHKYYLI